jgi:hypothetical protein
VSEEEAESQEDSLMTLVRPDIVASAVAALALLPTSGMAIDTDADDYVASPPGTNLSLLYYQHVQRDSLFSNGNQVPGNAGLESDTGILRVVHYLKLGDYVLDPQFILPFGSETGTNDASSLGSATGLADLTLAATTWLVNDDKTNTYLGITPFLFLPTGTYDKTKPLNWGENRWKFTLQSGYQRGITDKLSIVFFGDATVFGNNDQFGPSAATLKENPLYQGQFYMRYTISPTIDTFVGYSYLAGGATTVNGVNQNDRQKETKFSLGGGYFFTPKIELFGAYGQDISMANGFKESHRINLRLSVTF